eukprot:GDKI01031164.1.p1 GENE.GDKI01031164.1~~GDKI01031164.1.p1  ORF type:complete len:135 (-),score=34.70 GDKI01031164.1:31-408(-)
MSAQKQAPGPPHQQYTFEVDGISTDLVVTQFANKWFVVLTQYKKIGSLIESCIDDKETGIYSVRVLFGDRKKENLSFCVRALTEAASKQAPDSEKSFLFGLALKDDSPEHILKIVQEINQRHVFA